MGVHDPYFEFHRRLLVGYLTMVQNEICNPELHDIISAALTERNRGLAKTFDIDRRPCNGFHPSTSNGIMMATSMAILPVEEFAVNR